MGTRCFAHSTKIALVLIILRTNLGQADPKAGQSIKITGDGLATTHQAYSWLDRLLALRGNFRRHAHHDQSHIVSVLIAGANKLLNAVK
jgi:hypothetical protein